MFGRKLTFLVEPQWMVCVFEACQGCYVNFSAQTRQNHDEIRICTPSLDGGARILFTRKGNEKIMHNKLQI